MGLIDELKKEAELQLASAKTQQQEQNNQEQERHNIIQPKMLMIFNFLLEFCENLNMIQSNTFVTYSIKNYSVMRDLLPADYKVSVDNRKLIKCIKFSCNYSSSNRVVFDVENKLYIDRISEFLDLHHITYVCHKNKDSLHNVTNATFSVDSSVIITFTFTINPENNNIILNIENFNGLNFDRFVILPELVDSQYLESLGKYILRRDSDLFKSKITDYELEQLRSKLKKDKKLNKSKKSNTVNDLKNEVQISTNNDSQDFKKQMDVIETAVDTSVNETSSSSEKENITDVNTEIKDKPKSLISNQEILKKEESSEYSSKIDYELRNKENLKNSYFKSNRFTLSFSLLPSAFNPASREILDVYAHLTKLSELTDLPNQLINEATCILTDINKVDVPVMERIEVAHAIYITVYPSIVAVCAPYNSDTNKPQQNKDQLYALSRCIIIAEQIVITYKYAYLKFYSSNEDEFIGMRNNIIELGFRIIEMIRLEQRLRALRYEKLHGTTWLDLNQIFFSLLLHDAIDDEKILSSEIGLSFFTSDDEIELTRKSNIRDIYLSIQLFGVLDVITWPAHLFYFPDSYLENMKSALRIYGDDGQTLESGWLITFLLNDGPPVHKRTDSMTAPGIRIDFSNLHNALVAEHEVLAQMIFLSSIDSEKLSPPLAMLKSQDRIPVIEMILMALRRRERHHKRHNVFGTEKLVVNYGFTECYKVLSGYTKAEDKTDSNILSNIELIQQESIKLSDLIAPEFSSSSFWKINNFSTGGLLIENNDFSKTSTLQIGQIVSFKPKDSNNQPLLGYVGRIHRLDDHRVEISIIRLASYAESALVLDQKDSIDNAAKPVILSKDMNERWQIVLLHEYGYISGTPLKLIRSNGTMILLRLGDIWMSKRDFTVFEIRSAGL